MRNIHSFCVVQVLGLFWFIFGFSTQLKPYETYEMSHFDTCENTLLTEFT